MPKAIVSVTNDLYTDNRVNKVCLFLKEQGYDVLLVGRKRKLSNPLDPRSYKTKRIKLLIEKGAAFYAFFNLRLFFFLLFKKADLLVSNDLDTLFANYLAAGFKRNCRLVYDSHELFTEVPELIDRPSVQRIWLRIEEWIFPKLETIYTVNGSIAEIYANKYNKKIHVVRNVSPKWEAIDVPSKESLGLPTDKALIIMQGAGINVERGGEEAVEAMKDLDAVLLFVGDGDVVPQLKARVQELHLESKVLFFGKRPFNEMMCYTFHADIGLTLDKPRSLNYKFSLPNKVFDYIHARTAIVATDIKEVRKILEKYQIGEIVEPFSEQTLASTLKALISDKVRLKSMKENTLSAAAVEHWEKEKETLKIIYPKVG
ncbi:MAG: glycosyltransferase [Crocinitomicaceae bacterium]